VLLNIALKAEGPGLYVNHTKGATNIYSLMMLWQAHLTLLTVC
jgi:hypothetical protein